MAKGKASTKDGRTRNWTFIAYPESVPNDWRDVISQFHIQWAVSPLHDEDLNADGEQKKKHWHIMLLFEGSKSFEQVKAITDSINATIPIPISSVKGLVRYMLHMDNPEKKQYKQSDLEAYGGLKIDDYLKPTSSERYILIAEMIDYVKENEILELYQLSDYAREKRFDDWFPLLCDNSAYIIGQYIKSFRHSKRIEFDKSNSKPVDKDTGEIIES